MKHDTAVWLLTSAIFLASCSVPGQFEGDQRSRLDSSISDAHGVSFETPNEWLPTGIVNRQGIVSAVVSVEDAGELTSFGFCTSSEDSSEPCTREVPDTWPTLSRLLSTEGGTASLSVAIWCDVTMPWCNDVYLQGLAASMSQS